MDRLQPRMLAVSPITLADERVRLEPLGLQHVEGLKRAAADGELWTIRVTSVPDPDDTRGYVERALQAFAEGHRLAFAVLSRRRHTRSDRDWSSDVCSSDLIGRAHV